MRDDTRFLPLIATFVVVGLVLGPLTAWGNPKKTRQPSTAPSGIVPVLVDGLPSGRVVECVLARDESGSVAITCDWEGARP